MSSSDRPRRDLLFDQRGLSSAEHVMLLVLLCALAFACWNTLGNNLLCKLEVALTELSGALGLASARVELATCDVLISGTEGAGAQGSDAPSRNSAATMGNGAPASSSSAGAANGGGAASSAGTSTERAPPSKPASAAPSSATAWSQGIVKVMCPQDKAFLADLKRRGVSITLYDRIYFDDPYYDGAKWTTKRFEAGGTTSGTDVTILRSKDPRQDASTIFHEGVHTAQPSSMEWRDMEYEAYTKEDGWRISHGFAPHDPSFRTVDASGKSVTNDVAIRAFVDKEYPGVTSKSASGGAAERIVGKTAAGDTKVRRANGTTYTRAPKAGDSFPANAATTVPKGGVKVDMAKLQCP